MRDVLDIIRYVSLLSAMWFMICGEFTIAIGISLLVIAERVIFIADNLHKS